MAKCLNILITSFICPGALDDESSEDPSILPNIYFSGRVLRLSLEHVVLTQQQE